MAVVRYEQAHGRFARLKDDKEEGHDIDSFDQDEGVHGRKLKRRIEVKGKGVPWKDDEIVEQSDRQYCDAAKSYVEPGIELAPDFDYWLYVVEDEGNGNLNVLSIRNPAK